jgi:hypothetical protein
MQESMSHVPPPIVINDDTLGGVSFYSTKAARGGIFWSNCENFLLLMLSQQSFYVAPPPFPPRHFGFWKATDGEAAIDVIRKQYSHQIVQLFMEHRSRFLKSAHSKSFLKKN